MEAESVQTVMARTNANYQRRLAEAVRSAQNDNYEVEIHHAVAYPPTGGPVFSAIVVGRSRDYWRNVGGPT